MQTRVQQFHRLPNWWPHLSRVSTRQMLYPAWAFQPSYLYRMRRFVSWRHEMFLSSEEYSLTLLFEQITGNGYLLSIISPTGILQLSMAFVLALISAFPSLPELIPLVIVLQLTSTSQNLIPSFKTSSLPCITSVLSNETSWNLLLDHFRHHPYPSFQNHSLRISAWFRTSHFLILQRTATAPSTISSLLMIFRAPGGLLKLWRSKLQHYLLDPKAPYTMLQKPIAISQLTRLNGPKQ